MRWPRTLELRTLVPACRAAGTTGPPIPDRAADLDAEIETFPTPTIAVGAAGARNRQTGTGYFGEQRGCAGEDFWGGQ